MDWKSDTAAKYWVGFKIFKNEIQRKESLKIANRDRNKRN